MTSEEVFQALTDEAIYARRKVIIDAIQFEMDLLDMAIVIKDSDGSVEPDDEYENYVDQFNDCDSAQTNIIQSLSVDNIKRFNTDNQKSDGAL